MVRTYLNGNKKQTILDTTINQLEQANYADLITLLSQQKNYQTNEKAIELDTETAKTKPAVINYRRTFHKIHTYIRSIDKLDPSASFDEFSKVLFVKIVNDKLKPSERLTIKQIDAFDNESSRKNVINNWFEKQVSNSHYQDVFSENETIKLSSSSFKKVLRILENEFDLKDSLSDVKGRAFEEFLPSQLRGKGLGQFFTPRPIVEFMTRLADITLQDKVLDFAAGSGGFLIKAFDIKQKKIANAPHEFFELSEKTPEQWLELSKRQIYGIDAEPRAVRTAKMNMLLWGDGNQIQHGDGLDTVDFNGNSYYAKEYDPSSPDSTGVDVILANPPFGTDETNDKILANYELAKRTSENNKTSFKKTKSEILFIEKAYKMLKPNGRLLIVLPEGIFSNKNSKARNFILKHFDVNLIVRLPKHAFTMSGVDTINTVILMAHKKANQQTSENSSELPIVQNHSMKIQFASVNQIGYEPSGKIIGKGFEDSDLKILYDKLRNGNTDLEVANPFEFANIEFSDNEQNSKMWSQHIVKFIEKNFENIPARLDPTYYFFKEETKNIMSEYISIPGLKNVRTKNSRNFKITTNDIDDRSSEKTFEYISVEKNLQGVITNMQLKTLDDLLSTKTVPKKVFYNTILYNPYRINTGSIIRIDRDQDNLVTSPAYVNFDVDETKVNKEYLVQLLKTPFMKYQIQILASGSVRDNLSFESLKKIRIPNLSLSEQEKELNLIKKHIQKIKELEENIMNKKKSITAIFKF